MRRFCTTGSCRRAVLFEQLSGNDGGGGGAAAEEEDSEVLPVPVPVLAQITVVL